jgi:GNAT superfamily N-acetyltransferase
MMGTDDLTVYLAELEGQVIGTATLLTMPNLTYGCAPTAFVEAVLVARDHRRKGVASAIMRRLLADARLSRLSNLELARLAEEAHRSSPASLVKPPPTGVELERRRRFH